MSKGNDRLFDEKLTGNVKKASIKNTETPSGNIYYHPTEGGIIPKCIDINCKKPLHDARDSHPDTSSPEKWLEAYIIRSAKVNGWMLDIDGHSFQFLYSQLQFRRTTSDSPRPLDILLFERGTGCLVVLELKINRALITAKRELCYYCKRLSDPQLQADLKDIFQLKKDIKDVKGYIVWPEKKQKGVADNNDYGPFGVVEYIPWLNSKVLNKSLGIKFDLYKAAIEWSGCICDRNHS